MAAPAKEIQTQINCEGVQAYEGTRRAEFYFNDGTLGFVRILVDKTELAALKEKFSKAYGSIIFQNETDVVFQGEYMALRNDPPEILIASPEMMRGITGMTKPE